MTSFSSCTQYEGPAVHSQMPASAPEESGADQRVRPRTDIGTSAEAASSSGPQSSRSAAAAAARKAVSMTGRASVMARTLSTGRAGTSGNEGQKASAERRRRYRGNLTRLRTAGEPPGRRLLHRQLLREGERDRVGGQPTAPARVEPVKSQVSGIDDGSRSR